jgi:uncharacterized protein (TIGR02391 family)
MIPTDDDMKAIREAIEATAGMDGELQQTCGPLIRIGAFDDAVLKAFVVLEDRLRKAAGKEGLTGVPLASYAFSPACWLSQSLAHTPAEQDGLRELYSGAFKLFRNPSAHGVVHYHSSEGKGIIALVNLLLTILSRAGSPPLPLPENVKETLVEAQKLLDAGTASRLRTFVEKCMSDGLIPQSSGKQWIPFRRHALIQYSHWTEAKPYHLPVFYLIRAKDIGLWFPVNQYYANVRGLDLSSVQQGLKDLGFTATGKNQDYYLALSPGQEQAFFDRLLKFLTALSGDLQATLKDK